MPELKTNVELSKLGVVAGTAIPVDISVFSTGQVYVYLTDNRVPAVYMTDYTISMLAGSSSFRDGFRITPTASMLTKIAATGLANKIYIRRRTDITTEFSETDAFLRERIVDEFDKNIMRQQEAALDVVTAVKVPAGEEPILLPPAASRANKMFEFDADGKPVAVNTSAALVAGAAQVALDRVAVAADKVAAAASASAAAGSASAAAGSAGAAASSASAASGSASAAATSATNAAAAAAAAVTGKYDKTGGTLTGDVLLQKNTPQITLDKTGAQEANIIASRNGATRWKTIFGDSAAESGGNVGSDYYLGRYTDAGVLIDYPLRIVRSTGRVEMPGLEYKLGANTRLMSLKIAERITPQDFGAVGDGTANDTAAVQAAVTYCIANRRTLWLCGNYRITSTIAVTAGTQSGASGYSLCIAGSGGEGVLTHAFNDHLFLCTTGAPAFFKARDFKIVSTTAKSSPKVAFYFNGGLTRSEFSNIRYGSDGNAANDPWGFFTTPPATTADTINFDEIFIESATGIVYDIGMGSTIYFNGGRVIGKNRTAGSVGIRLLGGNGGVWINDTDCINLDRGMHVTQINGSSNREVFIKQAAFDGCYFGLDIDDTSYVNVQGLWASAAVEANIRVGTGDPTLNINGGTIFNSGVNAGGSGDGIQLNSGVNFVMSGVTARFNTGIAVRCLAGGKPVYAVMNGCTVVANGQGMNGQGTWAMTGNFFGYNTTDFTPNAGTYKLRGNFGSGLGDAG